MDDKASMLNAKSEILMTSETGFIDTEDKTFKLTQRELRDAVDMNAARKSFELNLDTYGPYRIDYTTNGNHIVIGGLRGHLAMFDWKKKKVFLLFL